MLPLFRSLALPFTALAGLATSPCLAAPAALAQVAGGAAASADDEEKADGEEEEPKTLADIVEGTRTYPGLIDLHHAGEKLYLELPDDVVGADLGFSALLVNTVGDWTIRGTSLGTDLVRFDRKGERVHFTKVNVDFRANPGSDLYPIVDTSFPDSPVFETDRIEVADEGAGLLIDGAELFDASLVEVLPESTGYSAKSKSILWVKSFEDNVVVRVVYRFEGEPKGDGSTGGPFARFQGPGRLADSRRVEVTVDYNLYRLPDDGYRMRFADERIGGMSFSYKDYDAIDHRDSAFRHVLTRWDLRKQDPEAELSPAIEPVTFYVDRAVPDLWRELIHEGTLWWNRAFERVGIQDAVRVLDQPEDDDWDPADMRHSMIYWNLSDNLIFSGLAGPSFSDPRTGQALRANVYLNAEFPSFSLHRYLVYAWWRAPDPAMGGMLSPREVRAGLNELRGESNFCDRSASFSSQIAFARLVLQSRGVLASGAEESTRFVREAFLELVSHEVGHALGFPHNWKASLASSWEDLAANRVSGRADDGTPAFSSSVMDYNPIYLAPRGQEQGDFFLTDLGAYDYLTVEYIYKPFHHMSEAEEARELDRIAAKAEIEVGLIFDGGGLGHIDPTTNSDDLGDDPVAFAETRLRMIHEEVLPRLPELVLAEGHDYQLIRQALDSAIFSVAMDYIDMLARQPGGQSLLRRVANSPSSPGVGPPPILPIDADIQRRALVVLGEQLFAPGRFALSADTLAQLKADMHYDWNYPWRYQSDWDLGTRIRGLYQAAFETLLDPARLTRILDNERRVGDAFTLPELFTTLDRYVFGGSGPLDADRRALQRMFVDQLIELAFEPGRRVPAEASQLAMLALRRIGSTIRQTDPGGDDYATAHRAALMTRIEALLNAQVTIEPR